MQGDGRAEFVGDVTQETLLAAHVTVELHGHAVNCLRHAA